MIDAQIFHSVVSMPLALLNNHYEIHREIWKAFPGLPKETPQPFTYRDLDIKSKKACFLVQSRLEPKWEQGNKIDLLRPVAEHVFALQKGNFFRYRVLAAPLVKVKVEGKKHSRHVALITDDRIWKWFDKKCDLYGIKVEKHSSQLNSERRHFSHPKHGKFTLTHVCFYGVCEVRNTDSLKYVLENGFANKKAYGFGMLNLINPEAK